MPRELGSVRRVLIAADSEQFRAHWPSFEKSVYVKRRLGFPVVGLGLWWNRERLGRELDNNAHLAEFLFRKPVDGEAGRVVEDWTIEGDHPEGKVVSGAAISEHLKRAPLIALANFAGDVMLIRTAFVYPLPIPLADLLFDDKLVKVAVDVSPESLTRFERVFGHPLTAVVDLRTLLLAWPFFLAKYDFHSVDPVTIGRWLLGKFLKVEEPSTNPLLINVRLHRDQIAYHALHTQLLVDLGTAAVLRTWGWVLPPDWARNRPFAAAVAAYTRQFAVQEAAFSQKLLRAQAPIGAKFVANSELAESLEEHGFSKALMWARPLPQASDLDHVSSAETTVPVPWEDCRAAPCLKAPFIAVSVSQLHGAETTSLQGVSGTRRYALRVRVTKVEDADDGGDGGAAPLNLDSAFAEGERTDFPVDTLSLACDARLRWGKDAAKGRRLERERLAALEVAEPQRDRGRRRRPVNPKRAPVPLPPGHRIGLGGEDFRLISRVKVGPPRRELSPASLAAFRPSAAFPNERPPLPLAPKTLPWHLCQPPPAPPTHIGVCYGGFSQPPPPIVGANGVCNGGFTRPPPPLGAPSHVGPIYGGSSHPPPPLPPSHGGFRGGFGPMPARR